MVPRCSGLLATLLLSVLPMSGESFGIPNPGVAYPIRVAYQVTTARMAVWAAGLMSPPCLDHAASPALAPFLFSTRVHASCFLVFQGEPGAYSEKALRELLGPHVYATGKPTFEDAFKVRRPSGMYKSSRQHSVACARL